MAALVALAAALLLLAIVRRLAGLFPRDVQREASSVGPFVAKSTHAADLETNFNYPLNYKFDEQIFRYFNLTLGIINETSYFEPFNECFLGDIKLIRCMKAANRAAREAYQTKFLLSEYEKVEYNKLYGLPAVHSLPKIRRYFPEPDIKSQNPYGHLNPVITSKFLIKKDLLQSEKTSEKVLATEIIKSSVNRNRPRHIHGLDCSYVASVAQRKRTTLTDEYTTNYNSPIKKFKHNAKCQSRSIFASILPCTTSDCNKTEGIIKLQLRFAIDIEQSNCNYANKLPSLKGGSTFEIFAWNDVLKSIKRCSQVDLFNFSYRAFCDFELYTKVISNDVNGNSKNNNKGDMHDVNVLDLCFNVTILLEYEHFDSYSDNPVDWSCEWMPLYHHIIWDNKQVCLSELCGFENLLNIVRPISSAKSDPSYYDDSREGGKHYIERLRSHNKKVLWHICKWTHRQEYVGNHDTNNSCIGNNCGSSYDIDVKQYFSFKELKKGSTNNLKLTEHNYNENELLHMYVDKLKFGRTSEIFDSFATMRVEGNDLREILSISNNRSSSTSMKYIDNVLNQHKLMELFKQQPRKKYIFIGASHMRYLFDSLTVYFNGTDDVRNSDRKHEGLSSLGGRMEFISAVYAYNMSSTLRQLCSSFNASAQSTSQQITLIIQTGDWDLTISPIRNIVHNPISGNSLIETIRMIYNGSLSCSGLEHLVWITSMPHPLCRNMKNPQIPLRNTCSSNRGYRTNNAISTLNSYYLNELSTINAHNPLKNYKSSLRNAGTIADGGKSIAFSVIDAFSIIAPRLGFSDDFEVVCANHFICRMDLLQHPEVDDFLKKTNTSQVARNIASLETDYLVFSPGGVAYFRTVLTALYLSLQN